MEHQPLRNTEAIEAVVEWGAFGDSVDKLNFLKSFCSTLSLKEVHHLKNILGHIRVKPECREKEWRGITWEDYKKEQLHQRSAELKPSELQPVEVTTAELKPLELKPAVATTSLLPKPWWKERAKLDYIALDVEKVGNRGMEPKAAMIAIVDTNYDVRLRKNIYHKPGSFSTHRKAVETSGITKFSLVNGEPWNDVIASVKDEFEKRFIIGVAVIGDFTSMRMYTIEDGRPADSSFFNLQAFYRRKKPTATDNFNSQEMSLRDIYFYHFKEDFQYATHDCLTDAKATMKVFLEGYIPMKLKGNPAFQENVEGFDFSGVPNLRSLAETKKFYCKPMDTFLKDCPCNYCKRYK